MVSPCHVVLASTLGLLPILIFLLIFLVSVVLLVLLFLVITSTLLLASFLVVILGSRGLLEVGSQLELALEIGKLCLHCHNLVFVR